MDLPTAVEPVAALRGGLRRIGLATVRDYGVVLTFVGLFVVLTIVSPRFLTVRNLLNILDQQAPVGIIACAMTLVIIGGGFDLSAGAIFALAGVVAAKVAIATHPAVGMAVAFLVAALLGFFNGGLISGFGINAFVATLSTGLMIRGLALVITGGFLVTVDDPAFSVLGLGRDPLLGIKYTIWLFAGVALITWFVLARTKLGRHVYAVGGNAEAALLSGVGVGWVRTVTFAISGLAAGLAGVISASLVTTGKANAGELIELDAIAAVVIGGTSIAGGEGAVWRTVVGVLLLAMIGNGFNLLRVEYYYQDIVKGAIIVFAVALDAMSKRGS